MCHLIKKLIISIIVNLSLLKGAIKEKLKGV